MAVEGSAFRWNRGGAGIRRTGRAYTLAELLVVISIIALLLSVLLPSLSKARGRARGVVCAARLYDFNNGLATYFHEGDEWIPGINTTGYALLVQSFGSTAARDMSQSTLPVQTFDWMTPLLRTVTSLPANRAQKFRLLLDEFRCPAINFRAVLWHEGHVADWELFTEEVASGGKYPGISYLMPAHFQLWGYRDDYILGWKDDYIPLRARTSPGPDDPWEVLIDRYKSTLERVGDPGEKIALADGTRFLPADGVLDFDYSPRPEHFGAFTSAGGWWRGSEAYGDMPPDNSSGGRNIPLSYRHDDRIQALFFDGHVELLSRRQSRKIDYWYPEGAVVAQEEEGFTDFETYPEGYVIR